MAEPTDEQLQQELVTQFNAYMTQLKRLLARGAGSVKHALDSLKINGRTLADLLALIRAEVKVHEDDPNNPHEETMAKLPGGMTVPEFEALTADFFPKDAVPLSEYPAIAFSIAGGVLTIPAGYVIYYGRKVTWTAKTLPLTQQPKQYVKINVTGPSTARVASFTLDTNDAESYTKSLYAIIAFANNAYTLTSLSCVKIGDSRLSVTPVGQGTPITVGTPTQPATINSGWIG